MTIKNKRFSLIIYLIIIITSILTTSCSTELDINYQYQILQQKISDTEGNFTGILDDTDLFGCSVANIGDLNNDGINDLAVGAFNDDDGGDNRGAVWILFLNYDGTVKDYQKISSTHGNFNGILDNSDVFGTSIANIGDLDNDGINDIAVGTCGDDDGGNHNGAVWILFLNNDGTVKNHQKISETQGNFTGILEPEWFSFSLANIGDLNKDGINDIAVGNYADNNGGSFRGAVWILFMDTNGTVKTNQKISDTEGNFNGILDNTDYFGLSIANIGDLNNDGINDIAVGAPGLTNIGSIWILFMNTNGTVKTHQKISDTDGNFTGIINHNDQFGFSVVNIGDLNNDGVTDIAVGARFDDDGGDNKGAVWILFLNNDGTVKTNQKISNTEGNFVGILANGDQFGCSIANIGYLNNDNVKDFAIGAYGDDDGGSARGTVWILSITSNGTVGP